MQEKYYHTGVGTEGGAVRRLLGGATGRGLDENIMSAYRWLAGHYKPGSAIYLFGFSRGAYTVRSLGGMIAKCGLLDLSRFTDNEKLWAAVEALFAAYRADGDSPIKATARSMPFHYAKAGESPKGTTAIHFIGVWDTVGSLGIPDDLAFLNLFDDPQKYRFHDTKLSKTVRHARHAVAIDERRQTFLPTLWENTKGADKHPDMQQVWFPGVHGDVGGGYAQRGLSDGALQWMIAEAEAKGLGVRPSVQTQLQPDPQDVLHDSVTGVFKTMRTRPRPVPFLDGAAPWPLVHASVYARQDNPPLNQGDYWPLKTAPTTLDIFARPQWNSTGIYVVKGKQYRFEAKGQWLDASIKCGPGGTSDGKFQLAEIVHVASSLFGKVEELTQKVLKNEQVDFWGTRREEDMPWFCLVGLIANNNPPPKIDKDSRAVVRLPHEVFKIGDGVTWKPKASGYLHCFTNDAWQAYDNNRGSVKLTVKEI